MGDSIRRRGNVNNSAVGANLVQLADPAYDSSLAVQQELSRGSGDLLVQVPSVGLDEYADVSLPTLPSHQASNGVANALGFSKKSKSDWILFFTFLSFILVVGILTGLLFGRADPVLRNMNVITAVLADRSDELGATIDHVMALVNTTSVDMMTRYADIISEATKAMDTVKDLVNDPQVQTNLQVITAGLARGDFEKIGKMINIVMKVTGAIAKSAGDNGITLQVGNWKAYVDGEDLSL